LRREEAAQALGLSEESFDRYVRDHVDCVRLGTLRIWPVSELERFLAERAEPVLRPRSRSLVPPFGPAPEAGSRRLEKGRRKRASAAERPL
jgi:predicted DNA-binding transcriptional regulator AlpA